MRISVGSRLYALVGALLCAVVVGGVWLERKQIPALVDLLDEDTRAFLTRTLFYVGGQPVRVLFVIKTFLFLLFLHVLSLSARRSVHRLVRDNPRVDPHREYLLSQGIAFAIYFLGLLIGIHVERINLSTLLVVGGTLGVAVGFGLQSLVSNLLAGLILLIEQPIRLGDRIEFGDKSGEVIRVGTRSSWIRTYENAVVVVPNADLVSKQVLNWTTNDPRIRVAVNVPVARGTDPEKVIATLLKIARGHSEVIEAPAPSVILSELGPSSTSFVIHAWTLLKVDDVAQLRSDLYIAILAQFRELEIEVPLPQLDIHLKSGLPVAPTLKL